ncbi:GDSL esterase/lipase At5g03610-like [Chenopodium quinoa]|uniref:GDSL esterase/lipase At5g03610-like n=1 Tax=Chenopodium quinoa TaxID=63459 RepID=UPI000B7994E2|nr:GDSL esterase/lipase At5g03610-like [Chenopodium quinoa]
MLSSNISKNMKTFNKIIMSFLLSLILLSYLFVTPSSAGLVQSRYKHKTVSSTKLFVFGDSYADTGNWKKTVAISWKKPYGITFPGNPSGRFSDGRILTDYIASYLNITSPIPYEQRNSKGGTSELKFGMNFAYGGTGVFDTDISQPNMTSQINLFKTVITQDKLYAKNDLLNSVALVSLAGNDYSNYLKHGSQQNLTDFTKSVVNQLVLDLQRIHNLGVPKIAVTAMEPLGCLPAITLFSGYKNCTQGINDISLTHNQLLQANLKTISSKTSNEPGAFFTLDLYGAFLSALQKQKSHNKGNFDYGNLLQPCCQGVSGDFGCGSNDGDQAKYTVCDKPTLAFFWDTVHPTQNGWYQVYLAIEPSLKGLH